MLLEDVKNALRVSTDDPGIVGEIKGLIAAAKLDLVTTGVKQEKVNFIDDGTADPLIVRAVILFCKAQFGYSNQESEKFQNLYEQLRIKLALDKDYRVNKIES